MNRRHYEMELRAGTKTALEDLGCEEALVKSFLTAADEANVLVGVRAFSEFKVAAFVFLPRADWHRAELLAHAKAWVGESYADLRPWGSLRDFLARDSHLKRWLDLLEGLMRAEPIVLQAPDARQTEAAVQAVGAVERCLRIPMERPPEIDLLLRPVSHVLLDLDEALSLGDVPQSRSLTEQAMQLGLDPIQWQGLRVRCDVAEGKFSKAVDRAVEARFHYRPVPRLVAEDLFRALYFRCLEESFRVGDWQGGVDALRSDEFARELLRGLPAPEATATSESRLAWVAGLVTGAAPGASSSFRHLLESASGAEHQSLLEVGKLGGFSDQGEDLETSAIEVPVSRTLEDVAEVDRVDTKQVGDPPVESWRNWADWVATGVTLREAREMVDEHHGFWTRALLDTPTLAAETAESIELLAAAEEVDAVVDIVLGVLLGDLIELSSRKPEANLSHLNTIFEGLLTFLADVDFGGKASLQWVEQLLEHSFSTGSRLGPGHMDALKTIWLRYPLRKTAVSAAIDLVSLLKSVDCEDPDRRNDVLTELVRPILITAATTGASPAHRLEVGELRILLQEIEGVSGRLKGEFERLEGEAAQPLASDNLKGKKVFLYTLSSSAAKHAREWIHDNVTDCRVTTDSSHAGSSQLQNQLRNQDYVVIAWKAAKHAATDFIKAKVGDPTKIVYAEGKGWSSLVAGVLRAGV